MRKLTLVAAAALVFGLGLLAAQAAESIPAEATAAARSWLALVDAGKYADSWTQSGALFRKAVTQEQWNAALLATRTPLGALEKREVANETAASTLPGAPDGKYVVHQFQTAFANKASAVETVTTVLETDGHWRVVGYFIR